MACLDMSVECGNVINFQKEISGVFQNFRGPPSPG